MSLPVLGAATATAAAEAARKREEIATILAILAMKQTIGLMMGMAERRISSPCQQGRIQEVIYTFLHKLPSRLETGTPPYVTVSILSPRLFPDTKCTTFPGGPSRSRLVMPLPRSGWGALVSKGTKNRETPPPPPLSTPSQLSVPPSMSHAKEPCLHMPNQCQC